MDYKELRTPVFVQRHATMNPRQLDLTPLRPAQEQHQVQCQPISRIAKKPRLKGATVRSVKLAKCCSDSSEVREIDVEANIQEI